MKTLYTLLIALTLLSCKKPEDRRCFKGAGNKTTSIFHYSNGRIINLYDDINLVLIQDSLNFLEIESYDNIIPFITIDTIADTINIANSNRCNFIRKNNKSTTVTAHISQLNKLLLCGSGSVSCPEKMVLDNFYLRSEHSSSVINLNLDVNSFTSQLVESNSELNIKGNCNTAKIHQSKYSITNAANFVIQEGTCTNKSTGDITCNVSDTLRVELINVGNILYYGTPTIISLKDIGLGKVEAAH